MNVASAVKPALADNAAPAQASSTSRSRQNHQYIWHQSPWKWFFSLGVGVTILVMLLVASIIGTMIDPLERAQALVFYTWWYKLLLLALSINMTCATIKTIVQKLLPTRALRVHPQKSFYETSHLTLTMPFRGRVEDVVQVFRRHGYKTRCEGDAGVARTGWYARFGAPVSHAGLVIVLLAGFASSWVAREGLVQIPEGRTVSTMQMRPTLEEIVPLGFTITVDDFSTGFHPRTRIPSHYTSNITARDGHEVLYAGPVEVNHSPKIKGWRLHQTSYQELPNLPRYEVRVSGNALNDPLITKISPGQTIALPTAVPVEFAVDNRMNWAVRRSGNLLASGSLAAGAGHDAKLSLIANRFEPDFVLGEDRKVASRSQDLNNPALHVTLLSNGTPATSQWLFGREDMRAFSHAAQGPFKMELLDIQRESSELTFVVSVSDSSSGVVVSRALLMLGKEIALSNPHEHCPDCDSATASTTASGGNADWNVTLGERVPAYATVLTLSRNPTIPVIYLGCVLMTLGLVLAFFVPRRDVWFMHDTGKGELYIAAHYRHLSDQFDRLTRTTLTEIAAADSARSTVKEQ